VDKEMNNWVGIHHQQLAFTGGHGHQHIAVDLFCESMQCEQ